MDLTDRINDGAPVAISTTTPILLSIFSFNFVMILRQQLVSRLLDRVECLRNWVVT
jgi:hypothetical protein